MREYNENIYCSPTDFDLSDFHELGTYLYTTKLFYAELFIRSSKRRRKKTKTHSHDFKML